MVVNTTMNDETIFFKTPEGEVAVKERTRLVQRNLRMVLILVDGFASVGDLNIKVGDPAIVEASLTELERMGLIESIDSRMASNRQKASQDSRPGAAQQAVPAVGLREDELGAIPTQPGGMQLPGEVKAPTLDPQTQELPLLDSVTVFDEEMATKVWTASEFTPPHHLTQPPDPTVGQKLDSWWKDLRSRRARAQEEAIYEKAYGKNSRISDVSVPPGGYTKAKPIAKSVRVKKARSLGSLWFLSLKVMVAFVVMLVVGVLLFPYDRFRSDFEQGLAQIVQAPVKIGHVGLSYVPYPVLALENVTVGEAGFVHVKVIHLLPEPGSIFSNLRYRHIGIDGLLFKETALPRLHRWFADGRLGMIASAPLKIISLAAEFGNMRVEGLSGTVRIDEHNAAKILLTNEDKKLRLEISPRNERVAVSVVATAWQPTFQPQVTFDRFDVEADLVPGKLTINKLHGLVNDGSITGSGDLYWGGDASLNLALQVDRIQLGRLMTAYHAEPGIEGVVSGSFRVDSKARSLAVLPQIPRVNGSFDITQGSLKRIDLVDALRVGRDGGTTRGGATRFEVFSGSVSIDDKSVRLDRLRLSSGLMQAYGQVSVSRVNGTIVGSGSSEMRGSANQVRSVLSLSGKVMDPELRASY